MESTTSGHEEHLYSAACEGGGAVYVTWTKDDTDTEVDVGDVIALFDGCIEREIEIDGSLSSETSGGANVDNSLTFEGQLTYGSGIGGCRWDAAGHEKDFFLFLEAGTICGVAVEEIEKSRRNIDPPTL